MATTLGSSARVAQLARIGEALDRSSRASAQREVAQAMGARGSGAGSQPLPDTLASGIEQLSGMSMDGVRVHHGSSKPAQLNALAYTQGDDIYVGRGQEAHVPHEAWHVVQQRQGRVQPTTQIGDVEVNDQPHLEREATVMGDRAAREAS